MLEVYRSIEVRLQYIENPIFKADIFSKPKSEQCGPGSEYTGGFGYSASR